ncbi:Gfo/Idh/MocA family protein [Anaerocolumna xylanovorans]|uniref:Predicted dehydrogenase n=1 Tax=Anaerocolumna xylanovorans DSM 12503 TaxID=1121345 RepID=A0A1M7Y1A9_9FIRM|nr:Gfo/Idh/MocA family oxidoreductase [Anaerocolumna xylanovorans]SHO45538.1 Predicted dehydrogenase [Anaerocolumna xylanovorans DSM 12503]
MKVHFGIIGLGVIAGRFANVLKNAEGTALTAVASREMERSEKFAAEYGAAKAYDNYMDLIQDEEIDIIYVALTHNFHYEVVKKCIQNGKAVLCEKPFVTNEKDADELIELAREKQVLLMEAMWTRCIPTFQKAKEWIASGLIGKPQLIQAAFCFHFPFDKDHRLFNPDLAGGSLYDAGVYPLEFATGILGENPVTVNGIAHKCATGVDDFVVMNLGFQSGALASLSCGLNARVSQDAYVYGTEGHIIVYDFLGSHKCERYDGNNQLTERFEVDFEDGFIYEIMHICELFREKKSESPLIPLADTKACAGMFDTLTSQG